MAKALKMENLQIFSSDLNIIHKFKLYLKFVQEEKNNTQ